MRVLLAAHGGGGAGRVVKAQGLLHHLAAALEQVHLPVIFVFHRTGDVGDGVHVLDLGARAERLAALRTDGDVHVAAHGALLHFAVGNADPAHDLLQAFDIFLCLVDRADIRLRDDLDQRHAAAVVIHIGVAVTVDQLAGVLLDVDMVQTDPSAVGQLDVAADDQRRIELADLVGFGEVGIAVVLSVHFGDLGDLSVDCQACLDGVAHYLAVEHGQRAGQADTNRTAVRVRLAAELRGAAAEDLCFGR